MTQEEKIIWERFINSESPDSCHQWSRNDLLILIQSVREDQKEKDLQIIQEITCEVPSFINFLPNEQQAGLFTFGANTMKETLLNKFFNQTNE